MANQPATNTFCWNELATTDAGVCTKFYTQLFGWTTELVPIGGGANYTVFKQGDTKTGGMLQMDANWGTIRPHWMPYILVDDVDQYAKRVSELGGKVCVPPTTMQVGRFAVVEDPTGGYFSIIKFNQPPA
jgi:predicted enzyme related to lactoylglutathione lyase